MASGAGERPVRVLVVDDSAVMRQLMPALLGADPRIEVVGAAADAYIAREKIRRLAPDVLTLDVEMPRMDGLSFLRQLMRLSPLPVVMVSTLTEQGASVTLDALASGAVDFIAKPRVDSPDVMAAYAAELRAKVLAAAGARVRAAAPVRPDTAAPAAGRLAPARAAGFELVAIGASTGGTEAIRQVLAPLPADMPPVVIAQHIPATFSAAFAERLDRHCALTVTQATDGEPLQRGRAYVAPGGRHLRIRRQGGVLRCVISDEPAAFRPSVDALFGSAAEQVGRGVAAALLTGMGSDGARGMLALRQAGARTVAQDRASSVVWGMPGAAVALSAASDVVPLGEVAACLLSRVPAASTGAGD
ncbi:chemotaxis response regulator protein-glutamate methylesterase [Lysobacter sp. GX 14042]|uniref:protein-glutamate methylesterase/protein-glutamine glutaminase n=1 Tax=Lysobacter sp. GX 14042 TaxID=2907155 RepID=UPI001F243C9B|nr:chemotaxis response regulator protein-glutamate methylesterase [Lysobacter sp. GX 14042]MCE7033323.1 chemotaxis response regulator protein-glutamate methylesterase [Lysobacter sp. GX 14042]